MDNSNKKVNFSGFRANDGDYILFINNKQVEFCLLLKKKCFNDDNNIDNYEVVRKVFSIPTTFGYSAKDAVTDEKYLFCRIARIGDRRLVVNNKGCEPNNMYILVPFREYYFNDVLIHLNDDDEETFAKAMREWQDYYYDQIMNTADEYTGKQRTRTSK